MESSIVTPDQLVAEAYVKYRLRAIHYVTLKLNNQDEAEDLVQDAFVRLLDHAQMLREDTIRYFLFTILRNLVTDYLRRFYKKQEITSYLMQGAEETSSYAESQVIASDLARMERFRVEALPPKARKVYCLHRYEDLSADDIAAQLHLSKRTVEGHLLTSRSKVREYMKECI